jgi:5'-phosphate synthase pdxT subunit
MKIGILGLQGDFERHQVVLNELGVITQIVKTPSELEQCQGLIIPGGESTTLIKLLKNSKLFGIVPKFGKMYPIFGTCAGLILLSKGIKNKPIESFGLLDVTVERNAYGRQINSFIDKIVLQLPDNSIKIDGVFIRAPKIVKIGKGVKILGTHKKDIIAVEENHIIATTFHPELTNSSILHQYFVKKVRSVH